MSNYENCLFKKCFTYKMCHFGNESFFETISSEKVSEVAPCQSDGFTHFRYSFSDVICRSDPFFEIVNFVYCFIIGPFLVKSLEIRLTE